MPLKKTPDYIKCIRSDMSDWLVYCLAYDDPEERNVANVFRRLNYIIRSRSLPGGTMGVVSGEKCISFSEAPLSKIRMLVTYADIFKRTGVRYAPFGVAVKKKWFFNMGGRPVIYQQASEIEHLSDEKRYLHVNYDPTDPHHGQDFSWEREWRYRDRGNGLRLDPDETVILFKNRNFLFRALHQHYQSQIEDSEGKSLSEIDVFPWGVIALDEIS